MPLQSVKVKKRPFIVFGQPDITEEEIQAANDVLRSKWIGTGRVTKEFEETFSKYMGGGYSISVSSCSIGLMIVLRALGIGPKDKVLTTPLTFCATLNAIINVGANPFMCDTNTLGQIDYKDELNIGKFSALMTVNYTGAQAGWLKKPNIPVIEDSAHSFGGYAKDGVQGNWGDVSVFSFYATKNITSGEGGMIWTKDKELADKCRIISNNGQTNGAWSRYSSGPMQNYQVKEVGFKGNMPDILSAIGLTQLKRWPEMKKNRDKVWDVYEKAIGRKSPGHSKHLYTVQVSQRDKAREYLYNLGIGTGIHYEALHLQPAYKYLGYVKGDFPNAEKIGRETLSLPVSNTMTREDAEYVVDSFKSMPEEYL